MEERKKRTLRSLSFSSLATMAEASSSSSSAALLLRPEPLEPDLDEDPPYFFRRIGEAAFVKFDGDDQSSSSSACALARPALASVPAAGVVAYSSGSRECR